MSQDHCCILHCIIGWECDIGSWSRVEGYPSDPNPNDPHAHVPKESLFKTDGRLNPSITILGMLEMAYLTVDNDYCYLYCRTRS